MLFNLIGHCPACVGALNVPTGLSSTLFKNYEVFITWTYSYGKDEHGQLSGNSFNFFVSRNFKKFSLFLSSPIVYSNSKMETEDKIFSLYGIDLGFRLFPIYGKFSKFRNVVSLLASYKLPIGFYNLNDKSYEIVDYVSFGGGYSFVYDKVLGFGEAIYSKALKDNHIQSDKSRIVLGFSYAFNKLQLGPILNYLYQKALNSNEISAGLSIGFSLFGLFLDLNLHKSIFYNGDGISNNYSTELILRGGF